MSTLTALASLCSPRMAVLFSKEPAGNNLRDSQVASMARVLVASAFVTLVLAVLTALMYNVPEFEDFRSKSVFLGGAQPVAFEAIAQGFYKLQIDWHMSPFHHEAGQLLLNAHLSRASALVWPALAPSMQLIA